MPNTDRRDLVGQLKNRALIYLEIYDVLARELGAARAEALLTEAIFKRGLSAGKGLAQHAPSDLEGLKTSFLANVPGGKDIFQPEVLRCDAGGLDMQLHGCPLKDAWHEAGLAPEKIATLCRIAGAVDKGLFQGAGFKFENKTWVPGAKGCCYLSVKRG
jgi:hypothetical protein